MFHTINKKLQFRGTISLLLFTLSCKYAQQTAGVFKEDLCMTGPNKPPQKDTSTQIQSKALNLATQTPQTYASYNSAKSAYDSIPVDANFPKCYGDQHLGCAEVATILRAAGPLLEKPHCDGIHPLWFFLPDLFAYSLRYPWLYKIAEQRQVSTTTGVDNTGRKVEYVGLVTSGSNGELNTFLYQAGENVSKINTLHLAASQACGPEEGQSYSIRDLHQRISRSMVDGSYGNDLYQEHIERIYDRYLRYTEENGCPEGEGITGLYGRSIADYDNALVKYQRAKQACYEDTGFENFGSDDDLTEDADTSTQNTQAVCAKVSGNNLEICEEGSFLVIVANSSGSTVKSLQVSGPSVSNDIFNALPSGVYFIIITNLDNGNRRTIKKSI